MRKTVKKYRNVQQNTATCSRPAAAGQADGRRTAVETSLTRAKVGRKKPYANRIRESNGVVLVAMTIVVSMMMMVLMVLMTRDNLVMMAK